MEMRMIRTLFLITSFSLSVVPFGTPWERDSDAATRLGWISDKGCATAKVNDDTMTPNGTECVKKCLADGATAVFVDPKARALYEVKNLPDVKAEVGYYLEVTGEVNETAKTISIASVKRLGDVIQMCGRKKR
jgi:hypothetical protein